jgi:hypothetical protein
MWGLSSLHIVEARGAARLALFDMRQLAGLCRFTGVGLPRFDPELDRFDEAA